MMPTKKEIKTAYDEAASIHRDHLAADDVKLPQWGTAKSYWLGVLMHYSPDYVSKDKISDITRQHLDVGTDQQVRHLKRDGWNLVSGKRGEHAIINPFESHSGYARQIIKELKTLAAGSFADIKTAYANKCATCGAREDEPDPRYGDNPIKLEEGHRDPEKPLSIANTIPQCSNCNKAYKDDFTFDKKGRVRAVASPNPVLRASKAVQLAIKEALKNVD